LKLYRGDRILNTKTEPSLYRSNGLLSVAFGSGANSDNIENNGIIQCVKYHVSHPSKMKKAYYKVSDFLSFTESYERAKYWSSERGKLMMFPTIDYNETRYIFEMDIDSSRMNKLEDGIYSFKYICNLQLRRSDTDNIIQNSVFEFINGDSICPLCKNKELNHNLILIDSYEFLMSNIRHNVTQKEIDYARNDKEWLVLPNDLEVRTGKRLTRIPRADFWKVHLFTDTNKN